MSISIAFLVGHFPEIWSIGHSRLVTNRNAGSRRIKDDLVIKYWKRLLTRRESFLQRYWLSSANWFFQNRSFSFYLVGNGIDTVRYWTCILYQSILQFLNSYFNSGSLDLEDIALSNCILSLSWSALWCYVVACLKAPEAWSLFKNPGEFMSELFIDS